MAKNEYDYLWDSHERDEYAAAGINEENCTKEEEANITRKVLKQFMAMFLEAHLAARYHRLGLQINDIELLQARVAELHHLRPSETGNMHLDELMILLAGEFEHVSIPPDAREVILRRTSDLQEWVEIDALLS